MNYTHYWTPKESTDDQWNQFVDVVKKMHDAVTSYRESEDGTMYDPIIIKNGLGKGLPNLGDNH